MDISDIRKLIRLIEGTDVTEIEVSEGERTVRVSRQGSVAVMSAPAQQYAPAAVPAAAAATPSAAPAPASAADDKNIMTSPMVGTFYRAASPESDPFVSEGKQVKKGDVLCIIEAMKLMNEIEAEYDGVVEKILTENAQTVEFGQPLFAIRPL